jgi:hypothetical protein
VAEASKRVISPTTLTVAQDDVAWVLLGQCAVAAGKPCVAVPPGARYGLNVQSEQNVSIVAQVLTRFDAARDVVGTVTSPGAVAPARSWGFARSRLGGERTTTLSVFNPEADAAVVSVGLVQHGGVDRPRALQQVTVLPGQEVTLTVVGGRRPSTLDTALTIDSNVPVFVERSIVTTDEAVRSVGVVVG